MDQREERRPARHAPVPVRRCGAARPLQDPAGRAHARAADDGDRRARPGNPRLSRPLQEQGEARTTRPACRGARRGRRQVRIAARAAHRRLPGRRPLGRSVVGRTRGAGRRRTHRREAGVHRPQALHLRPGQGSGGRAGPGERPRHGAEDGVRDRRASTSTAPSGSSTRPTGRGERLLVRDVPRRDHGVGRAPLPRGREPRLSHEQNSWTISAELAFTIGRSPTRASRRRSTTWWRRTRWRTTTCSSTRECSPSRSSPAPDPAEDHDDQAGLLHEGVPGPGLSIFMCLIGYATVAEDFVFTCAIDPSKSGSSSTRGRRSRRRSHLTALSPSRRSAR